MFEMCSSFGKIIEITIPSGVFIVHAVGSENHVFFSFLLEMCEGPRAP